MVSSVICRQRKIKCDGRKPCKTCTDAKRPARCEYQSAAPLRDDEYVRNLEEQLRLLSSQLPGQTTGISPEHNASAILHAYKNNASNQASSACGVDMPKYSLRRSQSPSVSQAQITEYTAPPQDLARQPSVAVEHESSTSASPAACESHYLTTLASPSTGNRHLGTLLFLTVAVEAIETQLPATESGDSSARTLLHGVEAALQQLPGHAGLSNSSTRPVRMHPTSPRYRPAQLPFAWNEGKAELYNLPQRHISDALINVYRALNYPSE